MEEMLEPFLFGLVIGALLAIVVYVNGLLKNNRLKGEIKKLKNHLHQKLEIEAESIDTRKNEVERLKKENENLRITNQTLLQKPGRGEIMNFHIYQKAVDIMSESAVGFAPMWQKSLKQAKEDYDKSLEGKSSFVKRIIPLNIFGNDTAIEEKSSSSPEDDD
ncbi:hypothetical protein R9C00_21670 [Flammeovirgaceae bacterium SG7u.111]|nr:hypothetical protein [Flammeovirgaceae bacterium SG7u.132]WPO34311.1 hypothetical protein R9C00_21670 [Flammeovirgaceae bacterium SG7u.111]